MSTSDAAQALDRQLIRELIENWVLWRDSGNFDRLRTVWHPGGRMMTTWCEVDAGDFVDRVTKAWASGAINAAHTLGGMTIDVAGTRAIAQTKMTITQRAPLDGVPVDVACSGRFYDFLEKREGRWGLVSRRVIYENDRLQPVDPSASVTLDPSLLETFPAGYRHLGYLQTKLGMEVARDLPGKTGPEVEALYANGKAWLAGQYGGFRWPTI